MKQERVAIVVLSFLYYLLLQYSYRNVEALLFPELGFVVNPPSWPIELQCLGLALLPSLFAPLKLSRPSELAYWLLYLTVIVPTAFLPVHIFPEGGRQPYGFQYLITILFCCLSFHQKLPLIEVPEMRFNRTAMNAVLLVAAWLLIALTIRTEGFHFDLSLESHYDRRLAARDNVAGGSFHAYAIATLSSAIAPILVSIGILRRQLFAGITGVIGLVSVYALSGTKTDLIAPLYLLGVYGLLKISEAKRAIAIAGFFIVLVFASISQYLLTDEYTLSLYICRRNIYVPALLNGYYWEFFSQHPIIAYSDSFLRWFWSSPYDLSMSKLIGDEYFGSAENSANANVWASAYGHLGTFGLFFATACLAILFRVLDSVAERSDIRLTCMMSSLFAITWANGSLETSILSNGIGVALIAIWMIGKVEQRNAGKSLFPRQVVEKHSLQPIRQSLSTGLDVQLGRTTG